MTCSIFFSVVSSRIASPSGRILEQPDLLRAQVPQSSQESAGGGSQPTGQAGQLKAQADPDAYQTDNNRQMEGQTDKQTLLLDLANPADADLLQTLAAVSPEDKQLHETTLTAKELVTRSIAVERTILEIADLATGSYVQRNRKIKTVQLGVAAVALGIKGDFVETGTWRGGTGVLMCKVLDKFSEPGTRAWWGADSFQGLPDVAERDKHSYIESWKEIGVKAFMDGAMKDMRKNLVATKNELIVNLRVNRVWDRPGLKIHILEGWFNETLPNAGVEDISFLRLDGDMYVSTMEPLTYLYPKLTVGGFIYVDDYGSFTGARNAVEEYRAKHGITTPFHRIPEEDSGKFEGIWWQKSGITG